MRLVRWWLLLVTGLMPWLGLAQVRSNSAVRASEPGPWGRVRYVPLQVSPPTASVLEFLGESQEIRWFVMISDKAAALAWLRDKGLMDSEIADVMARATQTVDGRGWLLKPSPELVLGLAPDVRLRFYNSLGQWQENPRHRSPFRICDHASESWEKLSGLHGDAEARFHRLIYRRGSLDVFTDLPLMLIAMKGDVQAQTHFLRAVCSESTYLASLQVLPGDDVDALVRYWGAGGREEEVRPLIEAASMTRGLLDVPIPLLLPGFARQVLYTYPKLDDMRFLDCHYSSINFFNREADPRLLQGLYRDTFFNAFYSEVPEAGELGDIILLLNQRGEVVHSCVLIADGLVFSKNGGQRTLPWMLVTLEDLEEYFSTEGELITRVYRHKAGVN